MENGESKIEGERLENESTFQNIIFSLAKIPF